MNLAKRALNLLLPASSVGQIASPTKARMRYMGHDTAGVLSMRRAVTRDVKVDIREAVRRSYALAFDFMQNSGWIAGAADQIIVDTIGVELKLNARPDLSKLGYDDAERSVWCRQVEDEWRRYVWNPAECDLAGKSTVAEALDGVMRYYLASGEGFGILDFMDAATRARYGLKTGTKVSLVSPHRVPHKTSLVEGWDGGVYHDEIGRVQAYKFRRNESGVEREVDVPARFGNGLSKVLHVMDRGATPNSPRGISPMTPCFKTIAQSDQLADATLTTALLQTAFAATIRSPEASAEAFEGLQMLQESTSFEGAKELASELLEVWSHRIDALKTKTLSIGGDASQINHLGPGEELEIHGTKTPGPQYVPFQQNMQREIARCLGITFENLTMDHSDASYSSTRMSVASIWPIVTRRRERIAAPFVQGIYEAWLDEMIGTGRIPFKGGYRAFRANFERVVDAEWRGPEKPEADPYKAALANKIELESGTATLQRIYAAKGLDWEEETDQINREVKKLDGVIAAPHGRRIGGDGAGPNGAAAEGMREPANG